MSLKRILKVIALGSLLPILLISAIWVVLLQYQNRLLFSELQTLEKQRQDLNIEWGKLQLEHGALTRPDRIERIATEQLNMHMPPTTDMIYVSESESIEN